MTTKPQGLAELEECRQTIMGYITEVENIADSAARELHTLHGALEHIDKQIEDLKTRSKQNSGSSASGSKKSAA